MSEIRQNLVTREWVIIATERAKRPFDFKQEKIQSNHTFLKDCPFCPGNEHLTPPEILRVNLENNNRWSLRVIPNKSKILTDKEKLIRSFKGINRCVSGIGIQRILIESSLHNMTIALLPVNHVESIIRLYKEQYNEIKKDQRIEHITIFKNHGIEAGRKIEHPHSQIIGLPIVPFHIWERMDTAKCYYIDNLECVYCRSLQEELSDGSRIIYETDHFVSFIPYGARSPFHIWLFPKRHSTSFGDINNIEIKDLAICLKITLAKIYHGLGNPDYNYMIQSCPVDHEKVDFFHWYISIIPRLTKTAGFELGSGMYINISLPEKSGEFLRKIEVSE